MAARILWRDAMGREGSVDLGYQEVRIGRAMDCELRNDDVMVSRYHARILWSQDGYRLEDLGSANGSFYNEQRITEHVFRDGDAVRCGSLWLRFVQTGSAERPRAGRPTEQPAWAGQGNPAVPPPAWGQPGQDAGPYAGGPPPAQAGPPAAQPGPPPAQAGPPAAQPGPPPAQAAPPAAQASPPAQPGPPNQAPSHADEESFREIKRLRRRVEQLEAELRIVRGQGGGADLAQQLEDAEHEIENLKEERDQLKSTVSSLNDRIDNEGLDARLNQANQVIEDSGDIIGELNDVLSNLRINVMAAEGEFAQFPDKLPTASYELILEALRSSGKDVDAARQLLRKIRGLGG